MGRDQQHGTVRVKRSKRAKAKKGWFSSLRGVFTGGQAPELDEWAHPKDPTQDDEVVDYGRRVPRVQRKSLSDEVFLSPAENKEHHHLPDDFREFDDGFGTSSLSRKPQNMAAKKNAEAAYHRTRALTARRDDDLPYAQQAQNEFGPPSPTPYVSHNSKGSIAPRLHGQREGPPAPGVAASSRFERELEQQQQQQQRYQDAGYGGRGGAGGRRQPPPSRQQPKSWDAVGGEDWSEGFEWDDAASEGDDYGHAANDRRGNGYGHRGNGYDRGSNDYDRHADGGAGGFHDPLDAQFQRMNVRDRSYTEGYQAPGAAGGGGAGGRHGYPPQRDPRATYASRPGGYERNSVSDLNAVRARQERDSDFGDPRARYADKDARNRHSVSDVRTLRGYARAQQRNSGGDPRSREFRTQSILGTMQHADGGPPPQGRGPPPQGRGPPQGYGPPQGRGPPPQGRGPPPQGRGPPPQGRGPPPQGRGPPQGRHGYPPPRQY